MNGILRCSGLPIEVKEVPEIIRILPIGEVKSRKGDFIVDDERLTWLLIMSTRALITHRHLRQGG